MTYIHRKATTTTGRRSICISDFEFIILPRKPGRFITKIKPFLTTDSCHISLVSLIYHVASLPRRCSFFDHRAYFVSMVSRGIDLAIRFICLVPIFVISAMPPVFLLLYNATVYILRNESNNLCIFWYQEPCFVNSFRGLLKKNPHFVSISIS